MLTHLHPSSLLWLLSHKFMWKELVPSNLSPFLRVINIERFPSIDKTTDTL